MKDGLKNELIFIDLNWRFDSFFGKPAKRCHTLILKLLAIFLFSIFIFKSTEQLDLYLQVSCWKRQKFDKIAL